MKEIIKIRTEINERKKRKKKISKAKFWFFLKRLIIEKPIQINQETEQRGTINIKNEKKWKYYSGKGNEKK